MIYFRFTWVPTPINNIPVKYNYIKYWELFFFIKITLGIGFTSNSLLGIGSLVIYCKSFMRIGFFSSGIDSYVKKRDESQNQKYSLSLHGFK